MDRSGNRATGIEGSGGRSTAGRSRREHLGRSAEARNRPGRCAPRRSLDEAADAAHGLARLDKRGGCAPARSTGEEVRSAATLGDPGHNRCRHRESVGPRLRARNRVRLRKVCSHVAGVTARNLKEARRGLRHRGPAPSACKNAEGARSDFRRAGGEASRPGCRCGDRTACQRHPPRAGRGRHRSEVSC